MQRRIIYFLTITVLFFGANFLVAHIASQTNPFSLRQMLNAVASVKEGRITQSKIISDIRKRKVDFQLTKENENLLRDEGATDEIIEAIRQNSPPVPTPTPTPTATPKPTPMANTMPSPTATPTPKPSSADASFFINQAKEYEKQERFDDAIAAYTEAIRIDPRNDETFFARGRIFSLIKSGSDYDKKALDDFTEAIRLNPKIYNYYFHRSLVYRYGYKDYDKAIADLDKAITLNPTSYPLYNFRGECHEQKGNYDLAIADFRKALELKPNDQSAKDGLARVLKKK